MPGFHLTPRQEPDFKTYQRQEFTPNLVVSAEPYELRFGIKFESLTHFDQPLLRTLHESGEVVDREIRDASLVAILGHERIAAEAATLAAVANAGAASEQERKSYLDALLSIYRQLEVDLTKDLTDRSVLFVGIEREGRLIADQMGWLPQGHSVTPHAKRVPFGRRGLLVGLGGLRCDNSPRKAIVVDGAIASGATLISTIDHLCNETGCQSVEILSAHATDQGLRALRRYARSADISLKIALGFKTDGLDSALYATHQDGSKVVGDLGDTICPKPKRGSV